MSPEVEAKLNHLREKFKKNRVKSHFYYLKRAENELAQANLNLDRAKNFFKRGKNQEALIWMEAYRFWLSLHKGSLASIDKYGCKPES